VGFPTQPNPCTGASPKPRKPTDPWSARGRAKRRRRFAPIQANDMPGTDPFSHTTRLAKLIDLDPSPTSVWDHSEFAQILKHQLGAKIRTDLKNSPFARDAGLPESPLLADLTFGEALTGDSPCIEILVLIKDFGKSHWHSKNSGLPKEIAMVLYYSALASALNHGHGLITKLPPESLLKGFQWAMEQEWVPSALKEPIQQGVDYLSIERK
jgi:hypothetical protein